MNKSLLAVIESEFPDQTFVLGGKTHGRRTRSLDRARFRRDLRAIAVRLRRRHRFVSGVLVGWLVIVVAAAALSDSPYANLTALGAMSGGTIWCIATLQRLGRELLAAEILLAAAQADDGYLPALAAACHAFLLGERPITPIAPSPGDQLAA